VRSSALVFALIVVLAAGCGGQESGDPSGQETDTSPPPVSTQPMPDPPVMTETGRGDIKLECANPTVMQVDHLSDVGGNPDPVKAARAQLGKQIRSDDVVERADTAEGKPFVRVVRKGELVAIVHLLSADRGWLVDQVEMCPDFAR
jgi:hypothetical protein